MKFGEKLRMARKERKLSLDDLAALSGVSRRSIINYEGGVVLPRQKDTYRQLANALHVSPDVFMDDNAEFVIDAEQQYGSRGAKQAEKLVEEITGLYAGGVLDPEDMDAMMRAIQDAYWIAKQKNRKFVPKKYRDTGESDAPDNG